MWLFHITYLRQESILPKINERIEQSEHLFPHESIHLDSIHSSLFFSVLSYNVICYLQWCLPVLNWGLTTYYKVKKIASQSPSGDTAIFKHNFLKIHLDYFAHCLRAFHVHSIHVFKFSSIFMKPRNSILFLNESQDYQMIIDSKD